MRALEDPVNIDANAAEIIERRSPVTPREKETTVLSPMADVLQSASIVPEVSISARTPKKVRFA